MKILSTNFYNSPADQLLHAQFDHRPPLQKTIDLATSLFRQGAHSLASIYYRYFETTSLQSQIKWKPDSEGFFMLVHGVHGSPVIWNSQLELLGHYPKLDVFAPIVHRRGVCSLQEAAEPLLPILLEYAAKNPKKPISLLGVSNGSRIVTWLENELRQKNSQTPVKVSTVAGVHFGTKRMDLLEDLGLAKWLYPKTFRKELKYGSQTARDLLAQLRAPFPENCARRSYEFYASTEDLTVPELDSSLPIFNKNEYCHILHGHSHDSIVAAVAIQQISSCIRWIKENQ